MINEITVKKLKQSFFALGTAVAGSTLITIPATAADFGFTFENAFFGGETVTGIIGGLEEGTGPASSVEVVSNTGGFGLGEYIGNPLRNSWTVEDGDLVEFAFSSYGINNSSPDVTEASLFFDSSESVTGVSFRAGIRLDPVSLVVNRPNFTTEDINLTFTQLDDGVQPVPEPTSILGLLVVLGLGTATQKKAASSGDK